MSEETLSTTQEHSQEPFDKDAEYLANAGNIARANFMHNSGAEESTALPNQHPEGTDAQNSDRFKKALVKTAVFGAAGLAVMGVGINMTANALDSSQDYLKQQGEDAKKAQERQNFEDGMDQNSVKLDVPSNK